MLMTRWLLTQFFRGTDGLLKPVCSAYGARWFCPSYPATDDGWALTLMMTSPDQVEAAKLDPRVIVCGNNDFSAIPGEVAAAYKDQGAVAGMKMGELRSVLADTEPLYLHEIV